MEKENGAKIKLQFISMKSIAFVAICEEGNFNKCSVSVRVRINDFSWKEMNVNEVHRQFRRQNEQTWETY